MAGGPARTTAAEKKPLIDGDHSTLPQPSAPMSPYDHSFEQPTAQAHLIVDVEEAQPSQSLAVRSPLQRPALARSTAVHTQNPAAPSHNSCSQNGLRTQPRAPGQTSTNPPTSSTWHTCPCQALSCLFKCLLRQILCIGVTCLILYYLYSYHRKYYLSKLMELRGSDMEGP
jgi:hypothetical protein